MSSDNHVPCHKYSTYISAIVRTYMYMLCIRMCAFGNMSTMYVCTTHSYIGIYTTYSVGNTFKAVEIDIKST